MGISLYQFTFLSSTLLSFSLIQIIFMVILFFNDHERGAKELGYVILCLSLYTIGTGFEYMSINLSQIMFWIHIQYIGLSWVSFFLIHFIVKYFNLRIPCKKFVYVFFALLSTLFMLIQFTYNFHSLFYADITFNQVGNVAYLSFTPKIFYYLVRIYQLLPLGLILYFSIQMFFQHSRIYKRKAIIIFLVAIIPIVANILYVLPIYSDRIDFIPFSIVGSSLILFFLICYKFSIWSTSFC